MRHNRFHPLTELTLFAAGSKLAHTAHVALGLIAVPVLVVALVARRYFAAQFVLEVRCRQNDIAKMSSFIRARRHSPSFLSQAEAKIESDGSTHTLCAPLFS